MTGSPSRVALTALELHAELREGTAGHHDDTLVDPSLDESRRHDDRVHRARTERLHVAAVGVHERTRFGDGLGHGAAASVVAVPDGFFSGADGILDRGGIDVVGRQEHAEGVNSPGFAGEVLEQNVGAQRLVLVVRPRESPHHAAVEAERQVAPALVRLLAQTHEVEQIDVGHELVEATLVKDLSEGTGRVATGGSFPPRTGRLPQLLRPEIAQEHLIGRIADRVLVGPQQVGDLRETLRFARGL
jgi:hypothetical protein